MPHVQSYPQGQGNLVNLHRFSLLLGPCVWRVPAGAPRAAATVPPQSPTVQPATPARALPMHRPPYCPAGRRTSVSAHMRVAATRRTDLRPRRSTDGSRVCSRRPRPRRCLRHLRRVLCTMSLAALSATSPLRGELSPREDARRWRLGRRRPHVGHPRLHLGLRRSRLRALPMLDGVSRCEALHCRHSTGCSQGRVRSWSQPGCTPEVRWGRLRG